MGISLLAHLTSKQKKTFSQWMGCSRFIWNAKCDEDFYLIKFAQRYLPTWTYPEIDQTFSQYKNAELSPWLSDCPSQMRFLQYKACNAGKAVFKVPAHHTSQECADCSRTHPDNRKTQALFFCVSCGHSDHADKNAVEVIKKIAINLILNFGTKLSSKGVLLDKGVELQISHEERM